MSYLAVGPRYYPPNPDGAQLIMRGPHGMRFAADPVITREGKVRGSGFRFWSEQQIIPPNEQWQPKQQVVGVMGLGDLPSGWTCPLSTRMELEAAVTNLENDFRLGKYPHEEIRLNAEKLRECYGQLGSPRSVGDRINRVHALSMVKAKLIKPGIVGPGGGSRAITSEERCRLNPQDPSCVSSPETGCDVLDFGCHYEVMKKDLTKALLVGGAVAIGGLFLYGLSQGLGKGLAERRK